ncbi:MAG: hypothetical protein ACYCZA_07580 [Thiobacillus sp.]
MNDSWKDNIYLQREELARMLREPLGKLAEHCAPVWGNCDALNSILAARFSSIPYCSLLYCMGFDGIQICHDVGPNGVLPQRLKTDRSQHSYMKEEMPEWGFLLSDAYIGETEHHPSLTALQVVSRDNQTAGYLGATFDLRNLPVTTALYDEPDDWRQVKGDPAIRSTVFQQCRVNSRMDAHLDQTLSILEELLTQRGVFQCQIHFSSSQATIWTRDDPFRYRILDHEALDDPDICLVYPARAYPPDAVIPQNDIQRIFNLMRGMRFADPMFYLRMALINISNGMVSVTFSCDGSHYMPHVEFLKKELSFWF